MTLRPLIAAVLFVGAASASAQINGEFYLDKAIYAPGEPVFLYFKVTNDGPERAYILSADPYSFCSGYRVTLSNEPSANSSCHFGFAVDCLSGSALLLPGKSKTERILLNYEHEISAAGDYSVEAVRNLAYQISSDDHLYSSSEPSIEVSTTLHFRIDDHSSVSPAELLPWVNRLRSKDESKRIEAARLLSSTAPPFLENTLLAFADNPEFRPFAPLAFHRLNTSRSIAALAEMLRKSGPVTYETIESARYLAQTNDAQWFPLLRDTAVKNAKILNFLDDAAELGGDQMLPTLIALTRSPDRQFTAINAVTAMGSAGSRQAVPLLLSYLESPSREIAERARYALQKLTHRTANSDPEKPPQSEYTTWATWWADKGRDAPIYKATDCGDLVSLD